LVNFQSYHPATYQIKYDRLYNRKFDNGKIGKYIDVFDFTSTTEGINVCLEEFIKDPSFNNINWRAEALKDRKTKEFAKLSEIRGVKQKVKYLIFRLFIK